MQTRIFMVIPVSPFSSKTKPVFFIHTEAIKEIPFHAYHSLYKEVSELDDIPCFRRTAW